MGFASLYPSYGLADALLGGFPENHLPAFSRVHVFANLLDAAACDDKDEAVVVVIRPSFRKRSAHPLFNDHRVTVGMDGAERDIDSGERRCISEAMKRAIWSGPIM